VLLMIEAGACGINLEDQIIGEKTLYSPAEQGPRIAAARDAARLLGVQAFINARTDVFLKAKAVDHAALLDDALARGRAYADAGADGLFVPGLVDRDLIRRVCSESKLPVNVMIMPGLPSAKELAGLGVARISYGYASMQQIMLALKSAAAAAFAAGG
jgi:2-methylisocitrate lyase-like PEP mutase family enzyme